LNKTIKILLIASVLFSGIAAVTVTNEKLFEISKNLEIFISAYKELNTNFVDDLDPSIMMRTAIDAMTNSLDPYTNFISESQAESYWINDDEKYQGIGARVGLIKDKFTIIEPYEAGPAALAGLKAGDEIIAVNGVNIEGKKLNEINAVLRGIPGTEVNILLRPYNENTVVQKKLIRGEVNIPNVPYSGFVKDDIGYISLTVFTANASRNITRALQELKEKNPNLAGVILDLRQNGGGLLQEAVSICNIFVPNGEVVVTTKSKIKERDQTFKTMAPAVDLEIPLAVLIDGKSASASEIVSGVIQDFDRGVLIGQRSYGKGLVQNVKDLPYNSRLKITISKYYIPSGRCIQGVEYANGEPKDIPDNLRSEFKTRAGRIVLDGGGVSPDIKMGVPKLYPVTKALLDQHLIFDFANNYIRTHDSIRSVEDFNFEKYDEFVAYTFQKKFTYKLASEEMLDKMKEDAATSNDKEVLIAEMNILEQKIKNTKQNDFVEAKAQIIIELEKEIISRYFYKKGKVQITLDRDPEVREAIDILRDTNRYKKILSAK